MGIINDVFMLCMCIIVSRTYHANPSQTPTACCPPTPSHSTWALIILYLLITSNIITFPPPYQIYYFLTLISLTQPHLLMLTQIHLPTLSNVPTTSYWCTLTHPPSIALTVAHSVIFSSPTLLDSSAPTTAHLYIATHLDSNASPLEYTHSSWLKCLIM